MSCWRTIGRSRGDGHACRPIRRFARHRVAAVLALIALPLVLSAGRRARADLDDWVVGDGDWSVNTNWSLGHTPGASDDARNVSSFNITHSSGNDTISSFLSSGTGGFRMTDGSLTAAHPGVSTFEVDGTPFTMEGGLLSGFVLSTSGASLIVQEDSSNPVVPRTLDNITVNCPLDIRGASLNVTNGLTLNNTAMIEFASRMHFDGDQTLGGTGSMVLQDYETSFLETDMNTTLTIDSGFLIHCGEFGGGGQVAGTRNGCNIINNGTISADSIFTGARIAVYASGLFTNNNVLEARNGARLTIAGTMTNTKTVHAALGSTVQLERAAVTQTGEGRITVDGGGTLRFSDFDGDVLTGGNLDSAGTLLFDGPGPMGTTYIINDVRSRIFGAVDLSGGSTVRFLNSDTFLSGSAAVVKIGNGGALAFQGDQTLHGGDGNVLFNDNNISNRLSIDGDTTLTIDSGILVHGNTGQIGVTSLLGGTGNLINNGTISSDGGGVILLNQSGLLTNNHLLEAQNGGVLRLNAALPTSAMMNTGTVLAATGSTVIFSEEASQTGAGTFTANGGGLLIFGNGRLTGGTLDCEGTLLFAGLGAKSVLDGVTVNIGNGGLLDLRETSAAATFLNSSTTLNGVALIGNGSTLAFQGDQTLNGTGSVVFKDFNSNNRLSVEGDTTLTIGSGIRIQGGSGQIGASSSVPGMGTIINNGKISAVSGGTLVINPNGIVTNNNVLEARDGGTLSLNASIINAGTVLAAAGGTVRFGRVVGQMGAGTVTVNAGGTLLFDGAELAFGTLTSEGTVAFAGIESLLSGVTATIDGTLDLTGGSKAQVSASAVTLNGTAIIGNNGTLGFDSDETLSGTGSVLFGDNTMGHLTSSNGTLTIGDGILIHGILGEVSARFSGSAIINNGTISSDSGGTIFINVGDLFTNNNLLESRNDSTLFIGGTGDIVNNGTVSADDGGTVVIDASGTFTNNSVLQAINGGMLDIQSAIIDKSNAQINVADNSSSIVQNGVTIQAGNINVAPGGEFTVTNSSNNFLTGGVTVNGDLDLSFSGIERVTDGLTLNGVVRIGGNGVLAFQGNQTLTGTGSVRFIDGNLSNLLSVEGNTTLTIDSGILIHGGNGQVGASSFAAGNGSIINNGTISSDDEGSTIRINQSGTFTNNTVLEARNGATLRLDASLTNGVVGEIDVSDETSSIVQNGVTIQAGTVNVAPRGEFIPTNSSNNFLTGGVTFNGDLDLGGGGIERVTEGLTLNGVAVLANGGIFAFQGDQTLGGMGSVRFSDDSSNGINHLSVDGNTTLTLGSTALIHGNTGQVGASSFVSGTGNIVNNGTIASDGGGTITVNNSGTLDNRGTLQATANSTLAVMAPTFTSSGTITVDAGSTIALGSASSTQTAGTAIVDGTLRTSTLLLQGGTLAGTGSITGRNLNNIGGTLAAGHPNAAGTLRLTGTYTQGVGATFSSAIGGAIQGTQYSFFQVHGDISLDGNLTVSLFNNFVPTLGEQFQILSFASNPGNTTFRNTPGNQIAASNGSLFNVLYQSTGIVLEATNIRGADTPEPDSLVLLVTGGALPLACRCAFRRARPRRRTEHTTDQAASVVPTAVCSQTACPISARRVSV